MTTILLLGGYGRVGSLIADRLLRETDASLVVAGRHPDRAEQLASRLNSTYSGRRVRARAVDASDVATLRNALGDVNLVLVSCPTTQHTEQVARAALAGNIDYLDLLFPSGSLTTLRSLAEDIEKSGRCFITQAGFHPGLVAPLVRFVAPRFSIYRKAQVAMVMNFRSISYTESAREFMEELGAYEGSVWIERKWRQAGWRDRQDFVFGHGFGVRTCVPLELAELRSLPGAFGLEELGCYVAGFNWFVDDLLIPLSMLLSKIKRGFGAGWLGRAWVMGMNTFSRAPYGMIMHLTAQGMTDGKPMSMQVELHHPDAFEFTAIAVVACLRQYLDGSIARPGLWLMGEAVEPRRLFDDLQRMGVDVKVETRPEKRALFPSFQRAQRDIPCNGK